MGAQKLLDSVSVIDADESNGVSGAGGHDKALFIVNITNITRTTGTLAVTVRWRPPGASTPLVIATRAAISATGVFILTLDDVYDDQAGVITRNAIPEPNEIFWDLVGDTADVTGEVYAFYGD